MTRAHETRDDIDTQAIIWHVRLRRADIAERHAFDLWLAQDPRHATAFDAIREADGPQGDATETADTAWTTWLVDKRRWLTGGLSVVAAAGLVVVLPHWRTQPYDVTTAAGERRVVALDAGTRVTLNGDTRMRFDRRDPRVAALIQGEALFQVRQDPARPFRLDVAGRTVEDVGTIFNVVSDPDEVRVAVAEGAVIYNPDREGIRLHPGQGLVDAATSDTIRLVETPATSIGGWRNGQFRYAATPLSTVAADLSRALGIRITAAPALAARPFTGTITLDGDGDGGGDGGGSDGGSDGGGTDQLDRLMPALDARLVRGPDGWTMTPLAAATR